MTREYTRRTNAYNISELCRKHTIQAVNTVLAVMQDPFARPSDRLAAANSVLDRAYGKATQSAVVAHVGADSSLQIVLPGAQPLIEAQRIKSLPLENQENGGESVCAEENQENQENQEGDE